MIFQNLKLKKAAWTSLGFSGIFLAKVLHWAPPPPSPLPFLFPSLGSCRGESWARGAGWERPGVAASVAASRRCSNRHTQTRPFSEDHSRPSRPSLAFPKAVCAAGLPGGEGSQPADVITGTRGLPEAGRCRVTLTPCAGSGRSGSRFPPCVWGRRRGSRRGSRVPCRSALAGTRPPRANVPRDEEGFHGCLSSGLFFLLSSLKNDFGHFIYIFNHG